MQSLFALLNAIARMSPGLQDYLSSILIRKELSKGDFFLKEGQINTHIWFIETGLVRIFYFNKDVEVSSWFLKEWDIFISVFSFFNQKPSYESIQVLEDCVCWGISFAQLNDVCARFEEFRTQYIQILIKYYSRSEERKFKRMRQSMEERYRSLAEEESELLARVPLHLLPSYIEMSDRTFSRVRNKYYRNKRKAK